MTYRIFVPFDSSDCARRALEHAIRLAKLVPDGEVHVAYAHEWPAAFGELDAYMRPEQLERIPAETGAAVLSEAEPRLQAAGVAFKKEILIGPAARSLSERAAALGCDAIVMGSHGRGAIGNWLMGSVATKVVHLSDIPVTLVK